MPSMRRLHAFPRPWTLLPYFTFFWCRDAAARLANEMLAAAYPKASAGLLASTFRASDSLKYCGMCVIDDTKKFGVPYWHRVHQLPEFVICPRHMILLQERLRSADLLDRHALPMPPDERNSLPTPQVNPALVADIADQPVNRVDEFLPWHCVGQLAPA